MDHFSLLPAELLIDIFDYLETTDVKATRAVSRLFRGNATPVLFRSVLACARHDALRAYQNISLHPIYSSYVKEIVFDGTCYNRVLANDGILFSGADIECQEDHCPVSAALRWKRYRALYNEQEDMKSNGLFLQTLVRGLKNMQNISSIVFSPNHHTLPIEENNLQELVPTKFYSPRVNLRDMTTSDHPFRQLIYAIFVSQHTGIRQLIIREPYSDPRFTEFSLSVFTIRRTHDMHAAKYVFRHLIKLELEVCIAIPRFLFRWELLFPANSRPVEKHPRKLLANLAELVQTAQDLQHLSLAIPFWCHWSQNGASYHQPAELLRGRSMFCHLGLGATWPVLRSLSLRGIYATAEDVMDFISRHRDTLRVVKFGSCSISGGFWSDIVDDVIFNAPMISTFVLDQVDEAFAYKHGFKPRADIEVGRYEGMLIETDGKREFIDTNPKKESVYRR